MKVNTEELIQIKKTKSVEMLYGPKVDRLSIYVKWRPDGYVDEMVIPMSKVFQVKRGLESAVQRFYRRKK